MASRDDFLALDRADPLAPWRRRFALPGHLVYLDGNSLGALPEATPRWLNDAITREWGKELITSWHRNRWVDLPQTVGAKIAPLIGARPDEVIVADSISVNLFKLLAAGLQLRPERGVVLAERGSFPTDLYMVEGLSELLGGRIELRLVEASELEAALDRNVALLMLTHVDYRTGRIHDMAGLTAKAHEVGALALWDLAHSAGAMPVTVNAAGADFAVGCGYKYLNGGPGAPAFVFVAERWQDEIRQPLSGWFGHARPFAFEPDYAPAPGIRRFLCGTPPILGLKALEAGIDVFAGLDLERLQTKAQRLTQAFIELAEERCAGFGLELASPREAERRGAQVAFRHADGYAIMQTLIAHDVIGDFRPPDLLRFGFAPLYVRFVDVWDAVEVLRDVLTTRAFDRPQRRREGAVP